IYVSQNNAESWSLTDASANVRAVRTLTTVGDTLVAGTFGNGVLRSTDGITWESSNNGQSQIGLYVSTLLTVGNALFAGTGNEYNVGRSIYRSTDFGRSWSLSDSGMPEGIGVLSLLHDEGILYAGTTRGVFLSSDLGMNWHALTDEEDFVVARTLTLKRGFLFAGTKGTGVYRSSLSEPKWELANRGLITTSVGSLLALGDTVMAGSYYSGLFQTTDEGNRWQQVGFPQTNVSALFQQGSSFYALAGGMVKSTDRGTSWQTIPHDFVPYFRPTIYSFAVSDSFLYAGVFHWDGHSSWSTMYRKSHSESNWKSVSYWGLMRLITSIVVSGHHVFAVVDSYNRSKSELFHSTNNGDNWQEIELPAVQIYSLYANGNLIFAGTSSGAYRSTDQGATWAESNEGLQAGTSATAFTMNERIVFVGTASSGVYFSTNEGQRWSKLGVNPVADGHAIRSLAATSTHLFAGADGRGVWTIPLNEITAVQEPTNSTPPVSFRLHQNYPNPFNPTTVISYQMPVTSYVELTIYNMLGQEVATIISGKLEAGTHRATWDATGFPSGVYFYRLSAGQYHETKKLILTK
ncbi:MAG TPA: T9SS type A sorting domain-containing protein, partial [Bacteroidota bacterium]